MKIKNIILNWAGVISNDFESNYEAVSIVMKSMLGKTISKEEFKREFKLPVIDFWHKYDKNIDFEKNKELYAKAIHEVTPPTLYEGVKEALEELHNQKTKLFVISSVPKDKLLLEAKEFGVDKYLEEINGGIYDKSSELKELIQRNNLNIKETAFVSHMLGDIEIAKDAGLITIAPTYGNYVSAKGIEENNPDIIMSDMEELLSLTQKNQLFAVIWDQTGVLYKNGREYVTKTFLEIFNKFDIPLDEKALVQKYRGYSLATQINMWERDFNVKISLTADKFSKEAAKSEIKPLNQNKEKEKDDNLIGTLEELKINKIPMALVTSSTGQRAKNILEILDQDKYIDTLISVDDIKNHEPAIDALELTSKKLGIPLNKCVVIEDGVSGIKAAKKAGCKTIGFAVHGEEQEQAIIKENPDLIIKDFSELNFEKIKDLFD